MTTNYYTKPAEFVTAWNAFRDALPPCPKTSTNPHFKNKFTPLDTWIDSALVASKVAGFAVVESISLLPCGDVLYQVHNIRIVSEHGEHTSEYLIGEVDKPQAMGSALTYARRYHLQTVLGATGEDDDDANNAQTASKVPVSMGAGRQRRPGTVA